MLGGSYAPFSQKLYIIEDLGPQTMLGIYALVQHVSYKLSMMLVLYLVWTLWVFLLSSDHMCIQSSYSSLLFKVQFTVKFQFSPNEVQP